MTILLVGAGVALLIIAWIVIILHAVDTVLEAWHEDRP